MIGGIIASDAFVGLIAAKVLESVSSADDVGPRRRQVGRRGGESFAERGSGRRRRSRGALLPRTVASLIPDNFVLADGRESRRRRRRRRRSGSGRRTGSGGGVDLRAGDARQEADVAGVALDQPRHHRLQQLLLLLLLMLLMMMLMTSMVRLGSFFGGWKSEIENDAGRSPDPKPIVQSQ